jgi:2-polyprenyl-3-methyl-5-hydroxy-6-metoxy-1,4-benzoquinol methylase
VDITRLRPQLDSYLNGVDVDRVATSIAGAMGTELAVARKHLETYIGEVRVAMRVVGPSIDADQRLLEVGSGIGLFAGFLRSINIDITELEPLGMGFQFIGEARSALAGYTQPSAHLDIGVEDLQPALHGQYDLIFSVNVLEHVADWRLALHACASVMAESGQMIHAHPNYSIPYEPHFSVPLVPFRPALTSLFLPGRITDTELWRSLNWITGRQVERWCRLNAVEIQLRAGVLAEALDRLETDSLFRQRHGGIVHHAASLANRLGLTSPLRRLPATLSTPLEYSIRRFA